jgi:5-(carboxyamino)imidazole ribonucleotide synthase
VRIGIIGAGQLGQMLGHAAADLKMSCEFLDPSDAPPAADSGPVIRAAYDDDEALRQLAANCDVLTYEFENVPVAALRKLGTDVPIYPPPDALQHAQDRLLEKQLFGKLDIPLPGYHAVDSRADLDAAIEVLGLPLVLKTRRLGYDGKGQFVVKTAADADSAWQSLGGSDLIAEQWVPFDFEVSVIGVRNVDGDTAIYPLSRNEHRNGILHSSRAPVDAPQLAKLAADYMTRLLQHLDYVGVLALELFVVKDRLLANEFAPRVHNSGHWTIEGAETSQFANHLRAICNQAPGSTAMKGHAGMLNLIGSIPAAARALRTGNLHDYGKAPREGRKLGHITIVADSAADRDALLTGAAETVTESTIADGYPA